jgi:hypothetical protein
MTKIEEVSLREFLKLKELVDKLEEKLNVQINNIENGIEALANDVQKLNKQVSFTQKNLEERIKIQEEIIMDMIKTFDDKFMKDRERIEADLREVKTQQDVVKISYTVNEKMLLGKIRALINTELKDLTKDKEQELLLRMWINELKDIVSNFEKLKKVQPKEFIIQINEISETIDAFRHKLVR